MQEQYEAELNVALAEGLLARGELESLRAEAVRLERSPLELLREQGRLSEQSLEVLRGKALPRDSPQGEPVFPVQGWERYQPVRFLGQGGMGQVFLAYDVRLRRDVALKFMRHEAPEYAHRFASEARAQARISHERVCQVYEVGEHQGHAYIAMQYVEGETLLRLAPQLSLEHKVLLLSQAAEGVHAAHRVGLIHRDIKPSNILVERTEEGTLKPYVMDFGLAHDWRGEATATGTVLGTPHYMAPEQARGEVTRLDRRADVYSLGATLYFLLTGEPPFSGGNNLEVLARIQTQEPRAPRAVDREVPEDLEAIALKCLEKERSARYDSARGLAEDLQRFLNGEPVRARRAGLGYRVRKRLRKHWRPFSLGAAALLVVSLALGQAVLAREEASERERLARRFTEQVERLEASARYSGMAPLHDVRGDREALRARMAELRAEIARGGAQAQGPGHYALGRAALALEEVATAREELERAWQDGYREPRVAWALALVLGRLYQEQLVEVERLRSPELREARRKEVERQYRDPALGWLRQGAGAEGASPQYAAALLAFYEGQHDKALEHLGWLGTAQPWLYEVPLLRGEVLLARAAQRGNRGDRPGALADFDSGRQAYAAAADMGRSVPGVHLALARLEHSAMLLELYSQGNVEPHHARALRALERALAADPEHYEALVQQASSYRRLAEARTQKGEEVQPLLEQALAAARQAQALAPERLEARRELASCLRQWGRALQQQGKDPREPLRQAIEALEGIPPPQRDLLFHGELGLTFRVLADHEDAKGEDSRPHRDREIECYQAALALVSTHADTWINLGTAYFKRASQAPGQPRWREDLERAREALEKARGLNPGNFVTYFYEAQVHERKGRELRRQGGQGEPELERACELYRQGLAINPRLPHLHNGLGSALLLLAQQAWEQGREPAALLAQARAAFEQAREVAPRQGFAWHNLGELHAQQAEHLLESGQDPGPSVKAAAQAYQQAQQLMPGQSQPWSGLGHVYGLLALWEWRQERDPSPSASLALQALEGALERNPKDALALRHRGEVQAVLASWRARRGRARDEDFSLATEPLKRALELAPQEPACLIALGHVYREWAAWRWRSGGEALPLLRAGLQWSQAAQQARPWWLQARLLRASLLLALARATDAPQQREQWQRQADEESRQGLSLHPRLEHSWRVWLKPWRSPAASSPP